MTTTPRSGTITIDTERFAAEARMMAYAMVNAFVTQHSIVTEALAMRPSDTDKRSARHTAEMSSSRRLLTL